MTDCIVCGHPDRAVFEARIAAGTLSQNAAAAIVGCNESSVRRHMTNHVAPAVKEQIRQDSDAAAALNVINALVEARRKTLDIYEESIGMDDREKALKLALLSIHEEATLLDKIAKITGQTHGTEINVFNAETVKLTTVILQVLERHPEIPDIVVDEMADALRLEDNGD
jgi:hypothetical protein